MSTDIAPALKPKRIRTKPARRIPSKMVDWKSVETLYASFGGQGESVALAILPDATDDERRRLVQRIRTRAHRGKWTDRIANKQTQAPKLQGITTANAKNVIQPISGAEIAARMHQNNKEKFLHLTGQVTAKAAQLLANKADKSNNFADIAQDLATFEPGVRIAKIVHGLGQDQSTNVNVQINALSGFKLLPDRDKSGTVIDI